MTIDFVLNGRQLTSIVAEQKHQEALCTATSQSPFLPPPPRPLTSDWSENSVIIIVYENILVVLLLNF